MWQPCLGISSALSLADALVLGLRLELELTPKPGLVDRRNNGSHEDLSYPVMESSVHLVGRYFRQAGIALENGRSVFVLRALGRKAEREMLRRFGTNTHRGAIFLGGLLMAGAHRATRLDDGAVSAGVAAAARQLFEVCLPTSTIGSEVRAAYRVGGIVSEATQGLPSVFDCGVAALRLGERLGMAKQLVRLLAMSRLMQSVEDTTTLRRCGSFGLRRLKSDGRALEVTLLEGADPIPLLTALDRSYRSRRMTMGGVADLLGVSIAWHRWMQAREGNAGSWSHIALRQRPDGSASPRHFPASGGYRSSTGSTSRDS